MHHATVFVLLFAVASAVALIARRVQLPYTVALVVAGLCLGFAHFVDAPGLTKDFLFSAILPGLLFEAAFHLSFRKFWENKLTIFALAVPGVVATILATAALLSGAGRAFAVSGTFSFLHGIVLAALLAATDPIAVVAMFRSLGAPRRLALLVEGESLINDGTAIVIFTLVLTLVSGEAAAPTAITFDFVRIVGAGLLVGIGVGFAIAEVVRRVDDPMIEITLTTVAAYGSFSLGEQLHVSGVIATVACGMITGNYAAKRGMSARTRVAVETFWEYVAFALNSIVFLLIGLEVPLRSRLASWLPILITFVSVTLGRALIMVIVTSVLGRSRERVPWRWTVVMTWGGLRGALSMVLALGLPSGFPHRELLVTVTFGVVVLSILLQGLTMRPLLRRLGLIGRGDDRISYELNRGGVRAARAALSALERISHDGYVDPSVLSTIRAEYEARITEGERSARAILESAPAHREELETWIRREMLAAEKESLLRAVSDGIITEDTKAKLVEELDLRLLSLGGAEHAPVSH